MMKNLRRGKLGLILATLLGMTLMSSCGSGSYQSDQIGNDVFGTLNEWSIAVDTNTAKAGEVRFTVINEGTIGHEFLIVKTDIANGEIPLVGDRFEEPSEGVEVIDEIEEFPFGETNTLIVTLNSGNYQLVCNLPGHYGAGMHTAFTVIE
jgi:uncharacterized cupredoxin-like copper-binding protein